MGTFGCSPSRRFLAENVQMCVHISHTHTHAHTLHHVPSFSFRLCPIPNSSLETNPLPYPLEPLNTPSHTILPRSFFTPVHHFRDASHPLWFPICISWVVNCKQNKEMCADLSSSGIYWKTLSTQNGQLQETGRNKERQQSEPWANSCHSSSAVRASGARWVQFSH